MIPAVAQRQEFTISRWYVWSKKRPSTWKTGMVFPGVQKSTWTYDKDAGEYYFHRFYNFQPDLNMHNPAVRSEIRRIMGYWLELGVAGFRGDAVPFISETPPTSAKDSHLNFEYLLAIRKFLQWRRGDAILLGEANVLPDETTDYFGKTVTTSTDVQFLCQPAPVLWAGDG